MADWYVGTVGEYTTSGATVNASLINPNGTPAGLAVAGGDLYVAEYNTGAIGKYITAGVPINTSLITGANGPGIMAVAGNDLFVSNYNTGIGEYTLSGGVINSSLIGPMYGANGIVVVAAPEPATWITLAIGAARPCLGLAPAGEVEPSGSLAKSSDEDGLSPSGSTRLGGNASCVSNGQEPVQSNKKGPSAACGRSFLFPGSAPHRSWP